MKQLLKNIYCCYYPTTAQQLSAFFYVEVKIIIDTEPIIGTEPIIES